MLLSPAQCDKATDDDYLWLSEGCHFTSGVDHTPSNRRKTREQSDLFFFFHFAFTLLRGADKLQKILRQIQYYLVLIILFPTVSNILDFQSEIEKMITLVDKNGPIFI